MSNSGKKKNPAGKKGARQNKAGKPGIPILLIGGGAILLLLAAIFVYYSNQPSKGGVLPEVSGAPMLKVDQERIDFGDVKVDTPVTATFKISNAGDKPLRFSQAPKVEVVEGC